MAAVCGIGGVASLSDRPIPALAPSLQLINDLLEHRGPDDEGVWLHPDLARGFAHRRLRVIDLDTGDQPMRDRGGNWITYNGEIYNYVDLRRRLGERRFRTCSDTEVVLEAYREWGEEAPTRLRGMFAFAIWDEDRETLFCARDRFGIKPFYYAIVGDALYFASEVKALLPFLPSIEIDVDGFSDYLSFQFCLGGKTLFKHVRELPPAHILCLRHGSVRVSRYWDIEFQPDRNRDAGFFEDRVLELLSESVALHLRADVPVGAYVSGGLDSSIVAVLASEAGAHDLVGFSGRFARDGFDESEHARTVAAHAGLPLEEITIDAQDFVDSLEQVVYHLDFPVAGPGSVPQYVVSQRAARQRKVLLGGQGGDEIFGGYTRYLIAYFEQCIKGAIEGTMSSGNFVVTYESIIPNLTALAGYKPLLQKLWSDGLFDDLDARYFRLVNRAADLGDEVRWDLLGDYSPYDAFRQIFHAASLRNGRASYFDSMTHFDCKTLLPALLHVEDRVSMAHGVESRVPFLDHRLVEFAATVPADVKFKGGKMKHVLRQALESRLPSSIAGRTDKMGFPVPLQEWLTAPGPCRDFVVDVLSSDAARSRALVDNRKVLAGLGSERPYGRRIWGLLCFELWQQVFVDRAPKVPTPVQDREEVFV